MAGVKAGKMSAAQASWPNNNARPEDWRLIRTDLESCGLSDFSLLWSAHFPQDALGESVERHYHWPSGMNQNSRARVCAIHRRAALFLGYESEHGWWDELRRADFLRFKLTGGNGIVYHDGKKFEVRSGLLIDVLRHSITLTHLLEADSIEKENLKKAARGVVLEQEAATGQNEIDMPVELLKSRDGEINQRAFPNDAGAPNVGGAPRRVYINGAVLRGFRGKDSRRKYWLNKRVSVSTIERAETENLVSEPKLAVIVEVIAKRQKLKEEDVKKKLMSGTSKTAVT